MSRPSKPAQTAAEDRRPEAQPPAVPPTPEAPPTQPQPGGETGSPAPEPAPAPEQQTQAPAPAETQAEAAAPLPPEELLRQAAMVTLMVANDMGSAGGAARQQSALDMLQAELGEDDAIMAFEFRLVGRDGDMIRFRGLDTLLGLMAAGAESESPVTLENSLNDGLFRPVRARFQEEINARLAGRGLPPMAEHHFDGSATMHRLRRPQAPRDETGTGMLTSEGAQ